MWSKLTANCSNFSIDKIASMNRALKTGALGKFAAERKLAVWSYNL